MGKVGFILDIYHTLSPVLLTAFIQKLVKEFIHIYLITIMKIHVYSLVIYSYCIFKLVFFWFTFFLISLPLVSILPEFKDQIFNRFYN